MNQRIRTHFGLEEIFVQPAAHDAGTALGAALEAHREVSGEMPSWVMSHAYLGPAYDDTQIEEVLKARGIPYARRTRLEEEVAQRLVEGQVVCWYQGRLEFGPRALGARSILADPRREDLRDRLNIMKGRQWWRPLGPSILAGREADYFHTPFHTPFMLFTLPVRVEKRSEIPAVVHIDGTSRPQSVTAAANPRYYRLIESFEQRTGVPMVINTSFNGAHEPIVESPADAVATFLELGADVLAIGDFLVERQAISKMSRIGG